jgi:hypothetical protein
MRKGSRVVCCGIHIGAMSSFFYRDLWEERAAVGRVQGEHAAVPLPRSGRSACTLAASARAAACAPRCARAPVAAFCAAVAIALFGALFVALAFCLGALVVHRLLRRLGERLHRALGFLCLAACRVGDCFEALFGLRAQFFETALPGVGQAHRLGFDQAADLALHFAQRAARMFRGGQQLLCATR